MKIRRIIMMMAMLTTVGMASADNVVVSNVEMKAGETKQITIDLNNPNKTYVAFQFDLVLPEGITIAKNNKNKYIAVIDEDRVDDHTLNVSDVGNNTYRFVAFSLSNAELYGTSGPLVDLTLKADEGITSGTKTATIKEQVFTEVSGTQVKWSNVSFSITFPAASVPKIQADNKSREYGADNPEFTYQVTEGELTGVPELTTTATKTSAVGTYPITVNRGTIEGDYEATDGTLTITKAPLTIAAGTYSKKQGEAMPEFTLTYTGFKNEDTKDVLTKQPVVSCDATAESAPGEYPITVSGAEAGNYEISYTAGKLIVTEADPVMASNLVVSNVEMKAGETKQITIDLNNQEKKYVGFQFDLVLPEGITIAKNNKNKYIAVIDEDRIDDHTLNVSDVGNNTYRFLAFSLSNAELYGTSGPLVDLTLKADEGITSGTKTATVKSQVFTEVSGTQVKWSDVSFSITIPAAVVPKIQADNKSREYGADNPEFTYQVTEGDLTGVPELATTATKTSAVGTYPITVNRGTIVGDYEATDGTLTITKAPLTIAAGTYSKKQGEAMPEFTLTYTGFKNEETKDVLTKQPVVSCDATADSAPGEYPITVSGAEAGNYEISYTAGKLIVTEADLVTVTAKSYTRKYGEDNPVFEFTSEGAALEGTPEISCEATPTSPVGTYPIVIKKGSVTNYNVSYVDGVLTIEKVPLTITAKSYTITQGDNLPVFEAEYDGFINGETSAVLTKLPVFNTIATSESEPNTYEITVSGAEAQNYEITYVKGTLTIEAKASGISLVSADEDSKDKWYTLDGVQLERPTKKGIYIRNGKKFVVK